MRRFAIRVAIAVALVGVGWTAGKAQGDKPDFEISIEASMERTTVTCVGCDLTYIDRAVPPYVRPQSPSPTFWWGCGASRNAPCPSGKIAGWIRR